MGWSSWHLNTVINLKITKQRATWYLCLLPNEGKLISYLHPKKKLYETLELTSNLQKIQD